MIIRKTRNDRSSYRHIARHFRLWLKEVQ